MMKAVIQRAADESGGSICATPQHRVRCGGAHRAETGRDVMVAVVSQAVCAARVLAATAMRVLFWRQCALDESAHAGSKGDHPLVDSGESRTSTPS